MNELPIFKFQFTKDKSLWQSFDESFRQYLLLLSMNVSKHIDDDNKFLLRHLAEQWVRSVFDDFALNKYEYSGLEECHAVFKTRAFKFDIIVLIPEGFFS